MPYYKGSQGRDPMLTQSAIWEATDMDLKLAMKAIQSELILRNMNRTITEPWLTNLVELELDTPLAEQYGGWYTHTVHTELTHMTTTYRYKVTVEFPGQGIAAQEVIVEAVNPPQARQFAEARTGGKAWNANQC